MPTLPFPKSGQPKTEILASMRRARDHDAQWHNGRVFGLVYHISDEIDDLLIAAKQIGGHGDDLILELAQAGKGRGVESVLREEHGIGFLEQIVYLI